MVHPRLPSLLLTVALVFSVFQGAIFSQGTPSEVRLRGEVYCVDAQGLRTGCAEGHRDFALETASGEVHYFMREDPKSMMFQDARVRSRTIEVRAWERPENSIEIIKVYSIKEGRLYDIHYYCSVCSITAYAGGPCWCCQDDFELREVPVEQ